MGRSRNYMIGKIEQMWRYRGLDAGEYMDLVFLRTDFALPNDELDTDELRWIFNVLQDKTGDEIRTMTRVIFEDRSK